MHYLAGELAKEGERVCEKPAADNGGSGFRVSKSWPGNVSQRVKCLVYWATSNLSIGQCFLFF